jgi:ankyrin repeat and fibronectin type-III domain-containing protein 1
VCTSERRTNKKNLIISHAVSRLYTPPHLLISLPTSRLLIEYPITNIFSSTNQKKKNFIFVLFLSSCILINSEEWELIKRNKHFISLDFRPKSTGPTEVQQCFLESLNLAAHRLFSSMDITMDDAFQHRLYDIEVIELSAEVSFLIICPPAESSCAVPGQREILLQRGDLLSMPVQAFEMIHLRTYQNSIIQKYSRLSCILELDTVVANHMHREAFSTSEVQAAKERLVKLQELTGALNAIWKGVRWLMDVITFARDKANMPGFSMKEILHSQDKENTFENENLETRQLLQLPQANSKPMKTSPGRGSWPGPAIQKTLGSNILLSAEHSKSEQQLVIDMHSKFSSRYLSATSGLENTSRKNSADSNCSHSGHSYYSACDPNDVLATRLPPSRSEDTLVMPGRKLPGNSHRKRSTTVNTISLSAASSPLLNNRSMVSTVNVDSAHSLSSDSETASCPLPTNERIKIKTTFHYGDTPKTIPTIETGDTSGSYLKSTLSALQNDTRIFKESLHIAEEESETTLIKPFLRAPDNTGGISGIRSNDSEPSKNHPERNPPPPDRRTNPFAQTSSAPEKSPTKKFTESDQSLAKMSASTSASTPTTNGASILQVYAAYATGLASGTSLKLRVTPRTTAREVIDLVVKQLNMAVVLKGKDGPIYTPDKLENFCLVAVIGARERCLRDDFQPLQLQNPWKKGRLFVRMKHDLLAAIEHCNREVADL